MRLERIEIQRSPSGSGRVRLAGWVSYGNTSLEPEWYWFEAPARCERALSQSGNPWVACLAPLAMTLGEPLEVALPVDRQLWVNIHRLMEIWKSWYPHLKTVDLSAEAQAGGAATGEGRTGAFFSGGVDSFFTVLWHEENKNSPLRQEIDDLITVWGFDIPLQNREAIERAKRSLGEAAEALGKGHIDIATNLRETAWGQTDWGYLSHNCALGSIGLALENRFDKVMIGSSYHYINLRPWGSHPLTDPLLSSSRTQFIHDGASYRRWQKTKYIACSPVVQRALRVCYEKKVETNCCRCKKCYRTMLTLEALGVLEHFSTFRAAPLDLRCLDTLLIGDSDMISFTNVLDMAKEAGRKDIAEGIERAFRYTKRVNAVQAWLHQLRKMPIIWRLATPLGRVLIKKAEQSNYGSVLASQR